MKSAIELLGCKVREKTTGYAGVVISISYDLIGCVQAYVIPPHRPGKEDTNGHWYDLARLEVGKRVMPAPNYEAPEKQRERTDKGSSEKAAPTRG